MTVVSPSATNTEVDASLMLIAEIVGVGEGDLEDAFITAKPAGF